MNDKEGDSGAAIPSRAHIATELANDNSTELDRLSSLEAVALVQREDARVLGALEEARESIAAAVDLIAPRLARGGRLIYVGAGTSGRLGVLDAVECPPTFQSAPEMIQGLLAGGTEAMFRSSEGAEDSPTSAAQELKRLELREADAVFGISAGGTTPYVHGALQYAKEVSAATVLLACVPFEQAPDEADVSIRILTGPEVLQGSTRLKAGSATKMALNTISTLVMARLGKVHGNRMVDVNTSGNRKLIDRGIRLVAELGGLEREAARECLEEAQGSVKLAILMARAGLDRGRAQVELDRVAGHLRAALEKRGL